MGKKRETSDTISDHWLIGFCAQPSELCVRGIDQSWQPFQLADTDKQINDFRYKPTSFVNDETLVVEAGNEMAVASVHGAVLFRVKLPKGRLFDRSVASSGGERFAVIENRLRGLTSEVLDMYAFPSNDRVVVYSIPDRRAIYTVKLNGTSPWPPWETHVNQSAISPDGTLLAVVSDGLLRVYRLPDNSSRK